MGDPLWTPLWLLTTLFSESSLLSLTTHPAMQTNSGWGSLMLLHAFALPQESLSHPGMVFYMKAKLPLHSNACSFSITLLQMSLCKRVHSVLSQPLPPLEATSHDSQTSVREGVVAGFVVVWWPQGHLYCPPLEVCAFPLSSGGRASLGNGDWHGVKQHCTRSAWLVGDFLGHKPSCPCGFFRTNTRWAAAQPA